MPCKAHSRERRQQLYRYAPPAILESEMIYTTMTRQKVLRLIARGWFMTERLYREFYTKKTRYYEVGVIAKDILDGIAYL